ncbi:MAG: AsmA-like C-terminal region-containing protein [Pseudomonadota bacterium]
MADAVPDAPPDGRLAADAKQLAESPLTDPGTEIDAVSVETARSKARRARSPRQAARRGSRGTWLARTVFRQTCRLALIAALAALLGTMFLGQTLTAPEWVRSAISAKIEQSLPGQKVAFGEMNFVMGNGWRPRVGVSNLRLTDADGRIVAELSRAEASLAMRPLMSGTLAPKKITLTGARAHLGRARNGQISLDFGADGGLAQEAETLPALIELWEEQLLRPPLDALTEFELTAVTLQYDDVQSGRSWTVDDGRLMLERDGDTLRVSTGLNLLSGRSYAAQVQGSYTSSIRSRAAQFGVEITDMAAEDIATQTPALGWLAPLKAPISGALRGGLTAEGEVEPLNATLRIGAGSLQPTDETRPIPFTKALAYLTFDPEAETLRFQELTIDSAWGGGTVEGTAWLAGVEQGRLDGLVGQFTARALTLNPGDAYPAPLTLAGAQADFQLRLDPFELTLGEAVIVDAEDPAHPFRLNGRVAAVAEGWTYALNGRLEQITTTRLLEIWPSPALVKPRIWVNKNVRAGRILDLDLALRGAPLDRAPQVYVDFAFAEGEVTFSPNMPPITKASGEASFTDNRLAAVLLDGQVVPEDGGALDVAGSSFIVPDVAAKPSTPAVVRIQGQGTPTAVLSLLNRKPLSVLEPTGLPVGLADGTLQVAGTLALPMQPKVLLSDMEFHASGALEDIRSTVLVPNHVLDAPRLAVFVDNDGVEISGEGAISDVPGQFTWRQPLGQPGLGSQVTGKVELSPRTLQTFNVGLPEGYVSGQGWGDITLDLGGGAPPRLALRSDLDGVALAVPPLGWRLSRGRTGVFEAEIALGPQPTVERLALSGAGLDLSGRVLTRPGGGFDRAVFDRLQLGGWLNVSGTLIGRGAGQTPAIEVSGGGLNLAQAQFGQGGAAGGPLKVTLDRLQIAEGLALTNLRGDLTTRGGLQGQFTGQMNGGTALAGQVAPESGRTAVQITSADAGGLFRDAGIVKQARGGDLTLTLRPAPEAGSFDGTLRVTNTNVREGSGIGALLNAISLVGLIDELAGNGLVFNEVDAEFRLSPTRLSLLSASAVGPSVGVSMDGIYDLASATLDMQGVLSPLYALNVIGSVMTRKGEGLIGFNFRLEGSAKDPKVSVNPLSALAPGFLREVFREPAPAVSKSRTAEEDAPFEADPAQSVPEKRRVQPLGGEDR